MHTPPQTTEARTTSASPLEILRKLPGIDPSEGTFAELNEQFPEAGYIVVAVLSPGEPRAAIDIHSLASGTARMADLRTDSPNLRYALLNGGGKTEVILCRPDSLVEVPSTDSDVSSVKQKYIAPGKNIDAENAVVTDVNDALSIVATAEPKLFDPTKDEYVAVRSKYALEDDGYSLARVCRIVTEEELPFVLQGLVQSMNLDSDDANLVLGTLHGRVNALDRAVSERTITGLQQRVGQLALQLETEQADHQRAKKDLAEIAGAHMELRDRHQSLREKVLRLQNKWFGLLRRLGVVNLISEEQPSK